MPHDPLDVLECELLVDREPEMRQLERDVREQLLVGEAVDDLDVRLDDPVRVVAVGNRLAEERRVRVQSCLVQPPQDDDALVERLACDEPAGAEAHPMALHEPLEERAVRGAEDRAAGDSGGRSADRAHSSSSTVTPSPTSTIAKWPEVAGPGLTTSVCPM